jgi:pimeloyl-ACP methyl ester carboxylesterase
MPTATIGSTTIHYQQQGDGRAVVFLHGYPLDSRIWDQQVKGLSAVARVIAPDLPGFGRSLPAVRFTVESMADTVHELLRQAGALPCVLGGLSMGGYIALAFARTYRNDLAGLMLIDTRADADSEQGRAARDKSIELVRSAGAEAIADQMLPKLLGDFTRRTRPDIVGRLNDILSECDPRTIEYALAALRDRPDQTPFLPDIAVPTLIVVGEHDIITPPAVAQAMRDKIAGSTLAVIPNSGHMPPMEQPADFNDAVGSFVRSLGSPRLKR